MTYLCGSLTVPLTAECETILEERSKYTATSTSVQQKWNKEEGTTNAP